jgi:hypothetical protein
MKGSTSGIEAIVLNLYAASTGKKALSKKVVDTFRLAQV